MARRPNLLIAGVQKGGTTWLHNQLALHPDCFMSRPKELNFFNRANMQRDPVELDRYLAHFDDASDQRYVGESTPHYFWVKAANGGTEEPGRRRHDTPGNIRRALGEDVTIIIILRDPVDRCESALNHHFSRGRIDASVSVFEADPKLGLVDMGFYGRHAQAWLNVFGERMHFFRFDDLEADNKGFLRRVLTRLELDTSVIETPAYARLPTRVNTLENLRARADGRQAEPPIRLSDDDRRALRELYRHDLEQAQGLTGLDLSAWMSHTGVR